ncbi:MAG: DNA phosphorothioation system sulfurtransferase DndC, partial [Microcoleus sp. Co-bin12]|nr:DNA phosphorothioation system sulfurtransferase DndC [Microcoleus sp. Co-bin12]
IYEEVTGEPFQDSRPNAEKGRLGIDEWTVLTEICDEIYDGDKMHLELMARLLDTEHQFHAKSRRGIYDSLEKCINISSRSREEAIDNAHYQRDVEKAVKAVKEDAAEIQEVKQLFEERDRKEGKPLTWANLKFPVKNSDEENSDD